MTVIPIIIEAPAQPEFSLLVPDVAAIEVQAPAQVSLGIDVAGSLPGPAGPQGPAGPAGGGLVSGTWLYANGTTPPASGQIKTDGPPVTTIYLSEIAASGAIAVPGLELLVPGDRLTIYGLEGVASYTLDSIVDSGDYRTLGVTLLESAGTFPKNHESVTVTVEKLFSHDHDQYLLKAGDTMTGDLTLDKGTQSNLYVKSVSQRLWAMARDSDLSSYLVSSDPSNIGKRPLIVQASKLLLASGAESATDATAVVPKSYVDNALLLPEPPVEQYDNVLRTITATAQDVIPGSTAMPFTNDTGRNLILMLTLTTWMKVTAGSVDAAGYVNFTTTGDFLWLSRAAVGRMGVSLDAVEQYSDIQTTFLVGLAAGQSITVQPAAWKAGTGAVVTVQYTRTNVVPIGWAE